MYTPGEAPLPTDEQSAQMFSLASAALSAAGYEHYEVSNYASQGHQCRHNLVYWRNQRYHAFGMAAADYVGNMRFTRPKTVAAYMRWCAMVAVPASLDSVPTESMSLYTPELQASSLIRRGLESVARVTEYEADAAEARSGGEKIDDEEELLDTLMLGLRLAEGLDMRQLCARFGVAVARETLRALVAQPPSRVAAFASEAERAEVELHGDDRLCVERVSRVRLTDPEGFMVSNDVISSVFADLDKSKIRLGRIS
jgi:coproporphyrinogen III oxidase-like Fe-S oxidoreductase